MTIDAARCCPLRAQLLDAAGRPIKDGTVTFRVIASWAIAGPWSIIHYGRTDPSLNPHRSRR